MAERVLTFPPGLTLCAELLTAKGSSSQEGLLVAAEGQGTGIWWPAARPLSGPRALQGTAGLCGVGREPPLQSPDCTIESWSRLSLL